MLTHANYDGIAENANEINVKSICLSNGMEYICMKLSHSYPKQNLIYSNSLITLPG